MSDKQMVLRVESHGLEPDRTRRFVSDPIPCDFCECGATEARFLLVGPVTGPETGTVVCDGCGVSREVFFHEGVR